MLDMALVLGIISVVGIPFALGLTMPVSTPGEFRFARGCLIASGALSILSLFVVQWLHDWGPTEMKIVVNAVIAAVVVGGITYGLDWLKKKESSISATAPSTVSPTVASTNQTGGQTAATITNVGPTYTGPVTINPVPLQSQIPTPNAATTFQEDSSPFPHVTWGCRNLAPATTDLEAGKEWPLLSVQRGDNDPVVLISLYQEKGQLHANVNLHSPKSGAAFSLKRNKFTVFGGNWQENHNERAIEVVNEYGHVVFQLVRHSKMRLTITGFVQVFGVVILFGPRGEFGTVPDPLGTFVPVADFLPKIFMYPSWKYPGRFVEPPPPQPQCPQQMLGRLSMITMGPVIRLPPP